MGLADHKIIQRLLISVNVQFRSDMHQEKRVRKILYEMVNRTVTSLSEEKVSAMQQRAEHCRL